MTDDAKLAEIEARHELDCKLGSDVRDLAHNFCHDDRATLLDVVEALRRERDEARASEARFRVALDAALSKLQARADAVFGKWNSDPYEMYEAEQILRDALAASERGS